MPRVNATSPDEYIAQLPQDRREALTAVREVIRKNLPAGYVKPRPADKCAWR